MEPRTMLGLADRASDSPYVHRVWTSVATGGPMTSVATARREIVFWSEGGVRRAALRGPETVPSTLDVPAGFAAFGIVLAHGARLLPLPTPVDDAVELPLVGSRFRLGGDDWEAPTPDTAEMFLDHLVRTGMLVRDPLVDDVLAGGPAPVGARSVERRVRAATGLPQGVIRRIDRAQDAVTLLGAGVTPADVVGRLGYHDHPHLTRSLTRFVGHGPSWLRDPATALSLPYKEDPAAPH